jgi:subtilisin family serine protease
MAMIEYRYGGKKGQRLRLREAADLVVVRTRRRVGMERLALSRGARILVEQAQSVLRFPHAGVEILRLEKAVQDEVRGMLNAEPELQFAGRVLADPKSRAPVLYTENLFVKFEDDVSPRECRRTIKKMGLAVKRELDYARNAFFVGAPEGSGRKVFDLASDLLELEIVELCHPELVREMAQRQVFRGQWHLKAMTIAGQRIDAHVQAELAWDLSQGEGITIAVVDDGCDVDHEEFRSPGKVVAPRDVTRRRDDARPLSGNDHGTPCAGVACADGRFGASGVAPLARLLPIRLVSGLGSQAEADAFVWAAQHGADVISCSWGPVDGRWWDPSDPLHDQVTPLPDSTRLAIDWAIRNGRNGRGCVITWAAGNGNESVDNDGYASYPDVIAVAASNDRGTRSVYSDFGEAIWCAFPSNDMAGALTTGIWTTDRSGSAGNNPGNEGAGDAAGNYTNAFGGTSSSCPGAAGIAALVLARNPDLRYDEVKDLLRRCCDRIDEAEGGYDAEGHSHKYGYGRLNARRAVELADPVRPAYVGVYTAYHEVPIEDFRTSHITVAVGDAGPIQNIEVEVDIEHSYIGDLVVRVLPPADTQSGPILLHDRQGGGSRNLKARYDPVNAPALSQLVGRNAGGDWVLEVSDKARADTGRILSFSVRLFL